MARRNMRFSSAALPRHTNQVMFLVHSLIDLKEELHAHIDECGSTILILDTFMHRL
jgi:hypothetical protein